MKTHAIIPIFLPHKGCPHDCIFCNQKKITAKLSPMEKQDVSAIVDAYLPTIQGRGIDTVEIAFFGGSFTGMPIEQQRGYLAIAKSYKDQGLIHKIRLSTRPDYITSDILTMLKSYDVDIIELGVQSFDPDVLALSNRGHDVSCIYSSSAMIKDFGFELGIQLMIGLPGDSHEKSLDSARKTVEIGPSIARIYPTIIIKDTDLESLYLSGLYAPLALSEAVRTAKDMFLVLNSSGINVIRIGLKSSDHITDGGGILGGTFHPAFRQLVDSQIAREILESQLTGAFDSAIFYSNKASFSNMIGHKKSNKDYFEKTFPEKVFTFKIDNSLDGSSYSVVLS